MINQKAIENAKKYIKANIQADDFSLRISYRDEIQTRFAQNAITQHMAGENFNVYLNVALGKKKGSASINQLNDDAIKYLIKTATDMAKINKEDPEYFPSQSNVEISKINNYSDETANLTVEEMVENIQQCTENAKSKDANVSGLTEKHIISSYLLTKNGFEGLDKMTSFGHSMTMKKDSVETKVSKSVKNYSSFDIKSEIERLNGQFDSLHEPQVFEPRNLPVILRPAAVFDLFKFIFWMLDMRRSDEGLTPFTDQLNKEFFGKKFSFRSVISDPDLIANAFSHGGVLARDIEWVKNGVINEMPLTKYYADLKKVKENFALNMLIDGENSSEQEMMSKVEEGLIINNLWYIRFVDMKKGELTGITRDGVLYFKDGKIQNSVNNLRWNDIPHELSRKILALGKPETVNTWAKAPTMLLEGFNFVDKTSF